MTQFFLQNICSKYLEYKICRYNTKRYEKRELGLSKSWFCVWWGYLAIAEKNLQLLLWLRPHLCRNLSSQILSFKFWAQIPWIKYLQSSSRSLSLSTVGSKRFPGLVQKLFKQCPNRQGTFQKGVSFTIKPFSAFFEVFTKVATCFLIEYHSGILCWCLWHFMVIVIHRKVIWWSS